MSSKSRSLNSKRLVRLMRRNARHALAGFKCWALEAEGRERLSRNVTMHPDHPKADGLVELGLERFLERPLIS